MKPDYPGIDYSCHSGANQDPETGIRYGIVSQNSLADWFFDEMEPVYIARCPECGSKEIEETPDHPELDNHCKDCESGFSDDETTGDTPDYFKIDTEEGLEVEILETEMFVIKSPVAIRAQFCSPCVPGAGNLNTPCDNGPVTYALPLEWFNEGQAPYSESDLIKLED